jgi:hypothetical protein
MAHKMTNYGSRIHCDECKQLITGDIWHLCDPKEMAALGVHMPAKWLDLECLLLMQLRR